MLSLSGGVISLIVLGMAFYMHIKCHAKYDKTDNATAKRKHKMAKSRPPSVPNSIVINVLFSLS